MPLHFIVVVASTAALAGLPPHISKKNQDFLLDIFLSRNLFQTFLLFLHTVHDYIKPPPKLTL